MIPAVKPGGRSQEIERREIVNGILYVLRSGCPWRMVPHDLPNWSTLYWYFREWKLAGVWEQVNAALRRTVREKVGREPEPSAAIVDSQSIKTSSVRGDARGYDGGKKLGWQTGCAESLFKSSQVRIRISAKAKLHASSLVPVL